MAHYAKVENGIVTQVIVAEQEFINSGAVGDPAQWIQTSYNTQGGVHTMGGTPLRKNYAGVGFLYLEEHDAFVPPKLNASWVLKEDATGWEPPIAKPTDGKNYVWDELTLSWVETESVLPDTSDN
jgi:hypothetical protein